MATVAPATELRAVVGSDAPSRVVLHGISWDLYERLRDEEANWHVRMAYDEGKLELMSPSRRHEEIGDRFTLLIVMVMWVLGLPCKTMRSTTWSKPGVKRGKEADCCFYLKNVDRFRQKDGVPKNDQPPDLVVEVEISQSALNTLGIYSSLGVPEVWRYDGTAFHIHILQDDETYLEVDHSPALPFLRVDEVVSWLEKAESIENEAEWIGLVIAWARQELVPRLANL